MLEKKAGFNYDLITVGIMYLLSFMFYKETFQVMNEGSRVFPRVIAFASFFFASILLLRSVVFKKREQYKFDEGMKVVVLSILGLSYVFIMKYIGFYLATPLFLVTSFKYLRVENKKVLIIIPIVMDLLVLVCFDILFRIPIPVGVWITPILKSINLI